MNTDSLHILEESSEEDISERMPMHSDQGNDEENINNSNPPPVILEPPYISKSLYDSLLAFTNSEKIYEPMYLERKMMSLCERYSTINNSRRPNAVIDLDYLEHSHYMFAFKFKRNLSVAEEDAYEKRLRSFDEPNKPDLEIYKFIQKVVKFLSQLMVRWGIFDINNHSYRYKGRSLGVKILDMEKFNKQCITCDILWFIYAIKHRPFIGKISAIIPSYAKILQFQVNEIFKILGKWRDGLSNV